MTDGEVRQFLDGRHTMNVATVGPTGHPHLVAMWYAMAGEDPVFWTYAKSQKIANLRRDPKLTCLVEDGETYETLRGVEVVGSGELIEDRDEVLHIGALIYERYFGELNEAALEAVKVMGAKRLGVRVHPLRTVSWDHAKLGGVY